MYLVNEDLARERVRQRMQEADRERVLGIARRARRAERLARRASRAQHRADAALARVTL